MSDDSQQPIIVKRRGRADSPHGGGSWKIAYADFVTAMMAFFILLWLIGSTADEDLKGVAEYFEDPTQISLLGGSGSGDSSSVIPGGGEDLSREVAQVRRVLDASLRQVPNLAEEMRERGRLIDLKGRIEAIIEANPTLRAFRDQILIDITLEGLRVQIVDEQNRPMFALSSAALQPYTRELLREIGGALNDVPNRLTLSGHTDAAPFVAGEGGFSNWELSANRANASRRELIAGGLDPARVARVVGLAHEIPFNVEDPFDPSNRRISIIVMNKRTEEALLGSGGVLDVHSGDVVRSGLSVPDL